MQKVQDVGCMLFFLQWVSVLSPKSLSTTSPRSLFLPFDPGIARIMVIELYYNFRLLHLTDGFVKGFNATLWFLGFTWVVLSDKIFSIYKHNGYGLVLALLLGNLRSLLGILMQKLMHVLCMFILCNSAIRVLKCYFPIWDF